MKNSYMAIRYWAATIFLVTLFTAIWALVKISAGAALLSIAVLFVGAILSVPFMLPCVWLLRIAAILPYSSAGKTAWFAVMYALIYMVFVLLLRVTVTDFFRFANDDIFFVFSTASIFIVTVLSRNDLQKLFKQQTNQQ